MATITAPSQTASVVDTEAKPISLLITQTSTFYSNLHPVLLLGTLLFSFRSLVADPVTTLLGLAPTIAILQAMYCILCFPVAQNGDVKRSGTNKGSTAPGGSKKKTGSTKPTGQELDIWNRVIPSLLSLTLTTLLSTPLLYITLILFGAPLTTHQPHTLLLALHLALLTTPHLFYVHGLNDAETWMKLASLQLPVDEVYGLSLGALVGAWVGAVPIPLDWDREWQRWPVTVVFGAYWGAVLGLVVGRWVIRGWRIKLS
ncbi:hypothetical protein LTR62_002686 [Meristemomyces frigidus]|uniref:Glycosylphosphatidylinositol anchor biosynthesis protein 11 n=1 Tax=Meristemomyces frigidus TaxID=1508187 RepID=A0AAN7YS15_9PEZI|nr:hypothetical protein LTR62_002686 [Meristemomyces frigidus]